MDLQHLDEDTAQLVLRLQLEDLQQLAGECKGKHREGETPDRHHALSSYEHEVKIAQQVASDQRMSKSIAYAVIADSEILQQHAAIEQQAAEDRSIARGVTLPQTQRQNGTGGSGVSDSLMKKLEAKYVWNGSDTESMSGQPECSAWAAQRKAEVLVKTAECGACGDVFRFFDLVQSPCKHDYCGSCLQDLFRASFVDEGLFPPRCCKKEIPVDENVIFLGSQIVGAYRAKRLEFDTKDKTYCHVADCSAFIPPAFIKDDIATCIKCASRTCVFCKAERHIGDCSQDEAVQQLLVLAAENGWQRCQSCNRIVELNIGCYHITCVCRAEFCYLCGVKWKNCKCSRWDERRLLLRSEQLANRHQQGPLNHQQRAALVERERQNLVENHECNHELFSFRHGQHRCEECNELMPVFTFECDQCHLMLCRRCMNNRVGCVPPTTTEWFFLTSLQRKDKV